MSNPTAALVGRAIVDARCHQEAMHELSCLLEQVQEQREELDSAWLKANASIAYAVEVACQGEPSAPIGKLIQLNALAQVYSQHEVLRKLGELIIAHEAA